MANFNVMVKGVWKGPFPEAALIAKFNAGGIPAGTKVQEAATGGQMTIEDLAAGATMVLDQPVRASTAKPASKLSIAERNAPTQKISKPALQKPAPAQPAAKPAAKPAAPAAKAAPAKPEPEKPAVVLPKKDSVRLPGAKLPKSAATRRALAVPEKKSRGVNWIFVLGCLALMGGFGAPWFKFEGVMADGGDLMLFGWNLPYVMTAQSGKLGAAPPAELFFAVNLLYLLYLAPLLALVALIGEFAAASKGKNQWWLRLLCAIAAPGIVAGGAFLLFSGLQSGVGASVLPAAADYGQFLQACFEKLKDNIQPGLYAFAAAPVLLLVGVVTSPKRKAAPVAPPPKSEDDDVPEIKV